MNTTALTDTEVLALYRQWSERTYASGFEASSAYIVQQFRAWLCNQVLDSQRPFRDYERAMLAEYRRQEAS